MNKCVVSGCPSRRRGPLGRHQNQKQKRFFPFPKDQARVKVWLAALRESERRDPTEHHLLCEDHFLPQHMTAGGVAVREDAIPIMPPYLDGLLGLPVSPWVEESSEEDQHNNRKVLETDVSLVKLTKALLWEMVKAPNGVLDIRQVVKSLKTRHRRVYEITSVLSGISLIQKESTNKDRQQSFQKELSNLKTVEDSLDEVIKTCAKQLFELTDNPDNIKYPFHIQVRAYSKRPSLFLDRRWVPTSAYVTYEDVSRIKAFQNQTVMVVKAPEDTKLEVPTPKEDSIQMNLRATRGPIAVVTSEMGNRPVTTKGAGFVAVECGRIRTVLL
ncbi:hypothetical protein NHX12_026742 [Muraenolepis orangiensis]|uniref:THAP-type domain-containing protein n=1 Tax=Muraenolepis orangiensis TaxID=630683 RepID=A0A9Q0EH51_9TELE|nr:hypothetical protein NHX12_026742 [Muraenolepis orangiensis]